MPDIVAITEASMQATMERLRILSHNMANVSTPGYKRGWALSQPFEMRMMEAGAPAVHEVKDMRTGALSFTGERFDVAMEEDGLLELLTPTGPAYTRQGGLSVDPQGRLVGVGGHPVSGMEGVIYVSDPAARIDKHGRVWEGERYAGQLRVVELPPEALVPLGAGLFTTSGVMPTVLADDTTRVRQGYLEASNVRPSEEMLELIQTVRLMEASQKVIRGYDEAMDVVLRTLADL